MRKAIKLLLSYRLQAHFDYMEDRLDRIAFVEAKLDRLEKLIRVAAPHPLGEPK